MGGKHGPGERQRVIAARRYPANTSLQREEPDLTETSTLVFIQGEDQPFRPFEIAPRDAGVLCYFDDEQASQVIGRFFPWHRVSVIVTTAPYEKEGFDGDGA